MKGPWGNSRAFSFFEYESVVSVTRPCSDQLPAKTGASHVQVKERIEEIEKRAVKDSDLLVAEPRRRPGRRCEGNAKERVKRKPPRRRVDVAEPGTRHQRVQFVRPIMLPVSDRAVEIIHRPGRHCDDDPAARTEDLARKA